MPIGTLYKSPIMSGTKTIVLENTGNEESPARVITKVGNITGFSSENASANMTAMGTGTSIGSRVVAFSGIGQRLGNKTTDESSFSSTSSFSGLETQDSGYTKLGGSKQFAIPNKGVLGGKIANNPFILADNAKQKLDTSHDFLDIKNSNLRTALKESSVVSVNNIIAMQSKTDDDASIQNKIKSFQNKKITMEKEKVQDGQKTFTPIVIDYTSMGAGNELYDTKGSRKENTEKAGMEYINKFDDSKKFTLAPRTSLLDTMQNENYFLRGAVKNNTDTVKQSVESKEYSPTINNRVLKEEYAKDVSNGFQGIIIPSDRKNKEEKAGMEYINKFDDPKKFTLAPRTSLLDTMQNENYFSRGAVQNKTADSVDKGLGGTPNKGVLGGKIANNPFILADNTKQKLDTSNEFSDIKNSNLRTALKENSVVSVNDIIAMQSKTDDDASIQNKIKSFQNKKITMEKEKVQDGQKTFTPIVIDDTSVRTSNELYDTKGSRKENTEKAGMEYINKFDDPKKFTLAPRTSLLDTMQNENYFLRGAVKNKTADSVDKGLGGIPNKGVLGEKVANNAKQKLDTSNELLDIKNTNLTTALKENSVVSVNDIIAMQSKTDDDASIQNKIKSLQNKKITMEKEKVQDGQKTSTPIVIDDTSVGASNEVYDTKGSRKENTEKAGAEINIDKNATGTGDNISSREIESASLMPIGSGDASKENKSISDMIPRKKAGDAAIKRSESHSLKASSVRNPSGDNEPVAQGSNIADDLSTQPNSTTELRDSDTNIAKGADENLVLDRDQNNNVLLSRNILEDNGVALEEDDSINFLASQPKSTTELSGFSSEGIGALSEQNTASELATNMQRTQNMDSRSVINTPNSSVNTHSSNNVTGSHNNTTINITLGAGAGAGTAGIGGLINGLSGVPEGLGNAVDNALKGATGKPVGNDEVDGIKDNLDEIEGNLKAKLDKSPDAEEAKKELDKAKENMDKNASEVGKAPWKTWWHLLMTAGLNILNKTSNQSDVAKFFKAVNDILGRNAKQENVPEDREAKNSLENQDATIDGTITEETREENQIGNTPLSVSMPKPKRKEFEVDLSVLDALNEPKNGTGGEGIQVANTNIIEVLAKEFADKAKELKALQADTAKTKA